MLLNLKMVMKKIFIKTKGKDDKFISGNDDNIFESDKEDEGMIMDDNLNVGLQQIASYFESPSYYYFSVVDENDKKSINDSNTDNSIGVIDDEDMEIDIYGDKY